MRLLAASISIFCAMLANAQTTPTPKPDIKHQTELFLSAYANGDSSAVLPMLASDIVVYGSDASEIRHGAAGVSSLLADDQRLWGGPAHIGPMQNVSVVQEGTLISIFFDADFSVGGRPPIPVRFAMVWRLTSGKWLLTQSSNVVPTQGQSAADLLKKN
jgi:ketosteroid isomerase-like protein